jgi:hypothetical protein
MTENEFSFVAKNWYEKPRLVRFSIFQEDEATLIESLFLVRFPPLRKVFK